MTLNLYDDELEPSLSFNNNFQNTKSQNASLNENKLELFYLMQF